MTFIFMEKKTIIIHNGWITSKNDGEGHFITASSLIQLYRINPKKHIVILNGPRYMDGIHLEPRYHGDYEEESERLGIL